MNVIKDEEFEEAFNHLGSDFGFENNMKRNSNYLRRFRYETSHALEQFNKFNKFCSIKLVEYLKLTLPEVK